MQSVNTGLEQRLENHKWQLDSIKALASVKRPQKEFKPHVIPLSSNDSPSNQLVKRKIQATLDTVDDSLSPVEYDLSLIDDPLWRKICYHIEGMMGSLSVSKIWKCKLGSFPFEENNIEVYCQTEETAQFLQEYAFVILGELKQYFPTLKELKVSQAHLVQ